MTETSPRKLLDEARRLIDDPEPVTRGLWSRAAALLARQALEAGLRAHWEKKAPALASAPFTTQLLCFPEYIGDTSLARAAGHTWSALSDACHHRGYSLAPTSSELRSWCDEVERVLDAVGC